MSADNHFVSVNELLSESLVRQLELECSKMAMERITLLMKNFHKFQSITFFLGTNEVKIKTSKGLLKVCEKPLSEAKSKSQAVNTEGRFDINCV